MRNKSYQKHKERLLKEARERHQNLSEEEKDKRRKKPEESFIGEEKEKHRERMQKLPQYRRNFYLTHKK